MVDRGAGRTIGLLMMAAFTASGQFHLPGTSGAKTDAPAAKPPAAAPAQASAPAKTGAPFAYYELALTWTPGSLGGFAVRALEARSQEGAVLENCGKPKPVPKAVASLVASVMPHEAVQAAWKQYGACTGLTASQYLTNILEARSGVQIPVQLTSLDAGLDDAITESPELIESQFASANPAFPAGAFLTACQKADFTGIRVCFDTRMKALACPVRTEECRAQPLSIRP